MSLTQPVAGPSRPKHGRVKRHRITHEPSAAIANPSTNVKRDFQDFTNGTASSKTVPLQRFSAPAPTVLVPAGDAEDELATSLLTDVDMADRSLGERLIALSSSDVQHNGNPSSNPILREPNGPVNAASLTRLLVQALHTSDPALLTLCLSHRDPVLIRNTIRKMPTPMALPLLKACVERLGQGKGSTKRAGGRGSGQNEQQGRGTIEWVKGVLAERGSLLMTMPSLPSHLAALSQLLSTRLQLYQPLLALSGRLDLALAQISMRRAAAEQAVGKQGGEGERYIEGESEDEEDAVRIEVDEEGEVEDIDMRANGIDEDEQEEQEDTGEDDEDEEDLGSPLDSGSEDGLPERDEAEVSGSGEDGSEEDDEEEE